MTATQIGISVRTSRTIYEVCAMQADPAMTSGREKGAPRMDFYRYPEWHII